MSEAKFTKVTPQKAGVYVWKSSFREVPGYVVVLVDKRPTESEPGNQLNGTAINVRRHFYNGCKVDKWSGWWLGPLSEIDEERAK